MSRPFLPDAEPGVETVDLADSSALVVTDWLPTEAAAAVGSLLDPAAATRTLHWGRNYLYAALMETADGPRPVVVKQFRNERLAARWKRRWLGSKARRSWRMARAFTAAGIPTAQAVLLAESHRADGPSHFVTEELEGVFESRYLFRAANDGREREEFPEVPMAPFLERLGGLLRRMHDAGLWHRDMSIGNVLVRPVGEDVAPDLWIIDLNRARLRRWLSSLARSRDLCRLAISRPEHRERFLTAYWGPQLSARRRFLYELLRRGFLAKIRAKEIIRAPFRGLKQWLVRRGTYAHIPPAPGEAGRRDKAVWDHLSDQPHQHAGRLDRLWIRAADARHHARGAWAVARSAPGIWRRYRQLKSGSLAAPVVWGGAGIALRPAAEDPEAPLAQLDDLGLRQVLVRLHPWDESHHDELELVRELAARGYDISFALPQNRELVRDAGRWRAAVERLAEAFTPYGRHFQIGQAINRSKWGIWNYQEYLDLVDVASEVLEGRDSRVRIVGPAVIDFEYHAAAAVLNMPAPGVHFDIVSSLLYVDRRGAPENRQMGLDTVGKVVLLRALAEASRNCGDRCWITEVNWPLREGPHSPAGRSVSVDEERQADYLVRYYLQALGTGLVERVYWWQLAAKGYGLVDPAAGGRRRPSFHALAQMQRALQDAAFEGPLSVPDGARLYRYRDAEGEPLLVGWSVAEPIEVDLPGTVRAASGRDGTALEASSTARIRLTPSPVYLRLA